MSRSFRFTLGELSGGLGLLGTALPIALGLVLVSGLDPMGVFLSFGAYLLLAGLYFRVPVSVEPMKVIGAYAIATGLEPRAIMASSLLMGGMLLLIGLTGVVTLVGRYTPRAVVRGVQVSTGLLLVAEGVRFMVGTSTLQRVRGAAEPFLSIENVGPLPVGIVLGVVFGTVVMLLLRSRRLPAALVAILGGAGLGLLWGTGPGLGGLSVGLHLPALLPFGFPGEADFTFALFALALPQLPMTLGNAIVANVDLSREYFGDGARRVTLRAVCLSMAFANGLGFLVGGMPMCHGAGGLAASYRFGARSAGASVMVGALFVALAVLLGSGIATLLYLLPMAVLGVLLVFAGAQLTLSIMDLSARKDVFVAFLIVGITLAANLAVGFIVGIVVAHALRWNRLDI